MHRVKLFMLILLCISSMIVPTANANAGSDHVLILGVFPRRNAEDTFKSFKPLANYLSQQLGMQVRLETAKDFNAFWENVKNRRYDFVHFNQFHYVESHDKYGYDVIAKNEEFGKSTLASGLVVRKDSGIHSLTELKGKKIVFGGGKKAMVAYIGNTALLRRAGLKDGDYMEEFAKNPPNATFATFYKQADAGGIGDPGLKIPLVKKKIDTSKLTFLALGEDLPHIPWAVKHDMATELKTKIQKLLLQLNNSETGKSILKQAKLTGIVEARDNDYDICRKVIKEVFDTK